MKSQGKLKVYTTKTCSFCNQAKRFLAKHNIEYTEIDANTPEGGAELTALGSKGVPTFLFEDNQMIVGFSEPQIMNKLGIRVVLPY